MKIGIIDYGSGNLHSAHNAVRQAASVACPGGVIERITSAPDLKSCDRIILPGVGHFADCYVGLSAIEDMIDTLNELVRVQARPFLGICVGMQLLADIGNEGGTSVPGLGWIPGDVVHLGEKMDKQSLSDLKIPHMGWNHIQLHQSNHPVLAQIRTQMQFYFLHSFVFQLADPTHCLATAAYGLDVAAVIGHENIIATQFHPEKSQQAGQYFLQEFLKWQP
ncbi:MAG: imidazole glycerol phosphate synthase subunit HisH [Rhodospirillaceae bacterium]|nr:imidazole glycerol phosphate synthase subunit HisH [Rhodospirillaceae bacterium]|tara:strand:- start:574 stop:1236 length:663 start_codon:yes stop_codon:yes gene_type:complete